MAFLIDIAAVISSLQRRENTTYDILDFMLRYRTLARNVLPRGVALIRVANTAVTQPVTL